MYKKQTRVHICTYIGNYQHKNIEPTTYAHKKNKFKVKELEDTHRPVQKQTHKCINKGNIQIQKNINKNTKKNQHKKHMKKYKHIHRYIDTYKNTNRNNDIKAQINKHSKTQKNV